MNILSIASILLGAASIASVFYLIPVVSAYAFWFLALAWLIGWFAK